MPASQILSELHEMGFLAVLVSYGLCNKLPQI